MSQKLNAFEQKEKERIFAMKKKEILQKTPSASFTMAGSMSMSSLPKHQSTSVAGVSTLEDSLRLAVGQESSRRQ